MEFVPTTAPEQMLRNHNEVLQAYAPVEIANNNDVLQLRSIALESMVQALESDEHVASVLFALQEVAESDPIRALYITVQLYKQAPQHAGTLTNFAHYLLPTLPEEDYAEALDLLVSTGMQVTRNDLQDIKISLINVPNAQLQIDALEFAAKQQYESAIYVRDAITDKQLRRECTSQIDDYIIQNIYELAKTEEFVSARMLCSYLSNDTRKSEASIYINVELKIAAKKACEEKDFAKARQLQYQITDPLSARSCGLQIDGYISSEAIRAAREEHDFQLAIVLVSTIHDERKRNQANDAVERYFSQNSK